MSKTILILGGGWGGLTAAHALKGKLPSDYRIAVIEKRQSFVFYPSFLRAMVGETTGLNYIESPLKNILRKDLEIINEEIIRINPETKTVYTNAQSINADYIIVAMGAELYPETIPGFNEHCLNLYDTKGAFEIHQKLQNFKKGKIAFLVTRTPFRCPPAPYEAAMLAEWFLREKGVKNEIEISIYTPEKFPMPSAGEHVGEAFRQILNTHNIRFFPENTVTKIKENKIIFSNNKEASYDLLIGVPPHGAPKAIVESGLTNSSGYVPVHPQTMEILDNVEELTTHFPGIYAIGDSAGIMLLNGKYLPKGGVFAEEEAQVVARNIASLIKGEKPVASFNGQGVCYVDVGDGMAAEGAGDFYAYPDPVVKLAMPSKESRKAKHEFERIFEWWFSEYQNK
ncbi:MAG: FAD/NAD(P)-binding oxidoreductase [Bacteroidota bacterium]|nr:FAD/NAD(P)-binding oxidoreductase [Bacteroidota bacterium]MDP3147414.1 FAD/NAD(P)-binding oxidoreductase [Bacteroidota bacterium]